MLKIRRSGDRLIFNMGIPTSGEDGLYIETGPRIQKHETYFTNCLWAPNYKSCKIQYGLIWILTTKSGQHFTNINAFLADLINNFI